MTTRRNLGCLLALAVSGALLVSSASSAGAQRLRTPDPPGDMVFTDDLSGTTGSAPNATVGDLTRVTVRYRARALSLRVRFAELPRTGHGVSIKGAIRAKGGAEWPLVAGVEPGRSKGTAQLLNSSFEKVSCRIRVRIEYGDVMVLRIPSRCVKKPDWVRLSLGSIHRDLGSKIYEDEAFNGHWSPRVHRGPRTQ